MIIFQGLDKRNGMLILNPSCVRISLTSSLQALLHTRYP